MKASSYIAAKSQVIFHTCNDLMFKDWKQNCETNMSVGYCRNLALCRKWRRNIDKHAANGFFLMTFTRKHLKLTLQNSEPLKTFWKQKTSDYWKLSTSFANRIIYRLSLLLGSFEKRDAGQTLKYHTC